MCSDNTFFLRTICVQNTWFLSVLFGAKCVKRAWSEISSEYMLFKGSFLGAKCSRTRGEMLQNTGRNFAEYGAKCSRTRGEMCPKHIFCTSLGGNVFITHVLLCELLLGRSVYRHKPDDDFSRCPYHTKYFSRCPYIVLNIFQDVGIVLNIFQDVRISY